MPKTALYVVCSFVNGYWQEPIKIGTTTNLKNRLNTLQTGSPNKLTYFQIWEADRDTWWPEAGTSFHRDLEKAFHDIQGKDKRSLSGEWYNMKPQAACFLIEMYARLAGNMGGVSKEEINAGPSIKESIPDHPVWEPRDA